MFFVLFLSQKNVLLCERVNNLYNILVEAGFRSGCAVGGKGNHKVYFYTASCEKD
jgi:hypothetical protein